MRSCDIMSLSARKAAFVCLSVPFFSPFRLKIAAKSLIPEAEDGLDAGAFQ